MKKTVGIVGFILALVFLILGLCSTTPDKYIKSYGNGKMQEYVGGDAYNFIIEASLRGGEISGAKTARAIYFSAAGILVLLSASFMMADKGQSDLADEIKSLRYSIVSEFEKSADPVSQQQEIPIEPETSIKQEDQSDEPEDEDDLAESNGL